MQTIIIKVDSIQDAQFLEELMLKFQFVKHIEVSHRRINTLKSNYSKLPIRWAKQKPDAAFAASIITNRKLSLTEIRDKAWKRNW